MAAESGKGEDEAERLAKIVTREMNAQESNETPSVEDIQDQVEQVLIAEGYAKTGPKLHPLPRGAQPHLREAKTRLMHILEDITFKDASESDVKREEREHRRRYRDGHDAQIRFGERKAVLRYVCAQPGARAAPRGDIHIHDLDFLTLTTTCTQIDLTELFKGGFSTGHGVLREPQDIGSYSALACIAIQSNQNDQHGGQSVPNFDYSMAPGVRKTFRKLFRDNLAKALEVFGEDDNNEVDARALTERVEQETGKWACLAGGNGYDEAMAKVLSETLDEKTVAKCMKFARKYADKETRKTTYQAMEALIHNLNTMHSRAGAQIPFSSLNYGMDVSPEARMVMNNVLLATEAGLGGGETPIFPIQIFKVKEGVNFNPGDPNYDLYRLAMPHERQAPVPELLLPGRAVQPPVLQARPSRDGNRLHGLPHTCYVQRVRSDREITPGRGNLSFTSVNLPRIAIRSHGDLDWFFEDLDRKIELVIDQLLERFRIISKRVKNFPFLMGEGVYGLIPRS